MVDTNLKHRCKRVIKMPETSNWQQKKIYPQETVSCDMSCLMSQNRKWTFSPQYCHWNQKVMYLKHHMIIIDAETMGRFSKHLLWKQKQKHKTQQIQTVRTRKFRRGGFWEKERWKEHIQIFDVTSLSGKGSLQPENSVFLDQISLWQYLASIRQPWSPLGYFGTSALLESVRFSKIKGKII